MVITATKFRQKTCLKCRGNHDNEGPLCGFCIDKEKQRREKQIVYPENYMVECLIEREGDTEVIVAGMRYLFKRNAAGHSVCDVVNYGHYKAFVEKMGSHYRAYKPGDDYPESEQEDVFKNEDAALNIDKAEDVGQLSDDAKFDDSDWPVGPPAATTKEPEYDGTGVDNGQAGPDAGGNCADTDRSGSGKQRSKRDRAGAGAQEVGSESAGNQPELCPGGGQQDST